jgi:ABC-2 type transport system permease protein
MNALVQAELLKLRSTRALWAVLVVVVAFSAALPAFIALNPYGVGVPELTPAGLTEMMRAPAGLAGGAVLLVGLLSATGEFHHRTVLTTRLVEPRQLRVLGAKMLAAVVVGLVIGLAIDVTSGASGAVALAVNDVAVDPLSHDAPRVAATVPILLAIQGLAGVAIGTLIRSTAGAVAATFLWVFVVEGVIPVVTRQPDIAHWLPGGALQGALALDAASAELTLGAAAVLLVGYTSVLTALAAILDARREV